MNANFGRSDIWGEKGGGGGGVKNLPKWHDVIYGGPLFCVDRIAVLGGLVGYNLVLCVC